MPKRIKSNNIRKKNFHRFLIVWTQFGEAGKMFHHLIPSKCKTVFCKTLRMIPKLNGRDNLQNANVINLNRLKTTMTCVDHFR